MLTFNSQAMTVTLTAGEDLNDYTEGTGDIYKAIAGDDGQIAANGSEAIGILVYGAASGNQVTVVTAGPTKCTAGGAVTKGNPLTVSASGYITVAASGNAIVGQALETTTSGSIFKAQFNNFGAPTLS